MSLWSPCSICGDPVWATDHDNGCPKGNELGLKEYTLTFTQHLTPLQMNMIMDVLEQIIHHDKLHITVTHEPV